ncbi:MAG: S66 peptidase family protein [Aestuariibacter sp.]
MVYIAKKPNKDTMYQYPPPLTSGATIAITAPSSGVPCALHPRLELVINHLQEQGYQVRLGQCLKDNVGSVSAPVEQRAAEFMAFLLDDNIAAVVPPYGGELATEILPLLDFARLRSTRAKWLVGYSDISTLCCAMTAQANWATVHSGCLMEWVPKQTDALSSMILSHLRTQAEHSFVQQSSENYQAAHQDWQAHPDIPFKLGAATQWQSVNHHKTMSGRLFGGCLDILMLLLDSPMMNFNCVKARHGSDGTILYLENAELSPAALKRTLLVMKYKGIFNNINGLLLGRNAGADSAEAELTYQTVISSCFSDAAFPVFYDVDIGHKPPNLTLINGAYATVELIGNKGTITQRLI